MEFAVRRIKEADWAEYRAIRLEMLLDTPMAFGDSYAEAVTRTEAQWRSRAGASSEVPSIRLAAITTDGAWIGSMSAFVEGAVLSLVGVYVSPDYRGDSLGVTSALMTAIEQWAREYAGQIRLDVHESNARAIAAYAKRGYVATGRTHPYPPDPTHRELEMVKQLRSAPGTGAGSIVSRG